MINKINAFDKIISCDHALIYLRTSWDQNGNLFTELGIHKSYNLDNYRLFTGKVIIYAQVACFCG